MWWGSFRIARTALRSCARFALALVALAFLSTIAAGPVRANPVPVDGKDPKDGTELTGFRVQSEDGKAFLYFLCDAGESNPMLWISHAEKIGESTKPFRTAYSIDGGPLQQHWFFVLKNLKSGAFFPRYNQMYEARFGPAPEMFDKQAGNVSQQYVDWYDNIYNTVIADFGFGGESALFRLVDTSGQEYNYLFNLIPVRDFMSRLTNCYEPPRNYVPVGPTG
jgi:hypothetical protein